MCTIDGDYPKFHAWCETCSDYAKGFDPFEHAADFMGSKIDEAMSLKDEAQKESK